jgi:hypothetical protein
MKLQDGGIDCQSLNGNNWRLAFLGKQFSCNRQIGTAMSALTSIVSQPVNNIFRILHLAVSC